MKNFYIFLDIDGVMYDWDWIIAETNAGKMTRGEAIKKFKPESVNALNYLIQRGYDPQYGARPLRRLIEQTVEDRIVEEILNGNIVKGDIIKISYKNNQLQFDTDNI